MLRLLKQLFGHPSILNPLYERLTGADSTYLSDTDKATEVKRIRSLYEPFKLIQRVLALLVVVTYIGVWLICVGLFLSGVIRWVIGLDMAFLFDSTTMLVEMNRSVMEKPALLVFTLYFGGGAVEGVVERFKTRKE